jgi:hypothetical protein
MQNYEVFREGLKGAVKDVKDSAGATVSAQKKIQKNLEQGNMTEVRKQLAALKDAAALLSSQAETLEEKLNEFDVQDYFVSGDFTRQLLEACEKKNIDVKGEKGVYEMFPYKIRIVGDENRQGEVWMDRKKVQSCRPEYVAETVKAGQEKLFAANFNPTAFITELGEAYEITCLRAGARIGSTQALTKIYKNLALMARARKEYDLQTFAFDLSRAYEKGPEAWVSKTGARFKFGTSHDGSGIRVLSSTGVESYISTLYLLNTEE